MNGKTKMVVGITLALSILSIAFLATPIQAYVNGNANGDSLQTQEGDRFRNQDCDCNDDNLQTQEQEGTQNCDCKCECTQKQYHSRQRTNECATNRICNCTISMEQHRHKYGERTRMQG